METRIASYQEPGIRLQLIRIVDYWTEINEYYQIRKNRKVLCNIKWESSARQKFNSIIQQHLLQTKLKYNMCPKRPCYKCELDRCLLFDNPELEPETRATNYNYNNKKQN